MNSPKQWLRSRQYNFVLRTVGDVVRPSDLIHLTSRLGEIRAELATLDQNVVDLKHQVSDKKWQSHIEDVTLNIGNHLNSVHEELRSFGSHLNSVHEELRSFGSHLNSVHEEVRSFGSHLNSVHEEVRHTSNLLLVLAESHSKLQKEFAIQKLQVRAKPYSTSSIEILSSRDGRPTIGYETSKGGNYADFIENFRPTFSELLDRLTYVKTWLPNAGDAVDLGAGRGEMVQIMRQHGLTAYGIDSDPSVVSVAKDRDIDVRLQEIDHFLDSEPESILDVITAIQVVEHVDTLNLEKWFHNIRKLLRPDGVFIAETPNPHAIDAFKSFWIDTTHVRPYYPESLLHMAQAAGFVSAEIWVEGREDSIDERLGYAGSYTLIAVA